MYVYALRLHLRTKILASLYNLGDYCTVYQVFVAPNGRRQQKIVRCPDTYQVVEVHHYGILGYAVPHRNVVGFSVVHIRQSRFCASTVGVRSHTKGGVVGEVVGQNFAERPRIKPLIQVFYGCMNVFLARRNAPLVVFV